MFPVDSGCIRSVYFSARMQTSEEAQYANIIKLDQMANLFERTFPPERTIRELLKTFSIISALKRTPLYHQANDPLAPTAFQFDEPVRSQLLALEDRFICTVQFGCRAQDRVDYARLFLERLTRNTAFQPTRSLKLQLANECDPATTPADLENWVEQHIKRYYSGPDTFAPFILKAVEESDFRLGRPCRIPSKLPPK